MNALICVSLISKLINKLPVFVQMQPTISVNRGDDNVVQTPATDSLCSVRRLHRIRRRRFLVSFHRAESTASCTLVTKYLKYIRINENL